MELWTHTVSITGNRRTFLNWDTWQHFIFLVDSAFLNFVFLAHASCVMPCSQSGSVAQSCPAPCHPMNYSPPGSSGHGFFPARILEWVAISLIWPNLIWDVWEQGQSASGIVGPTDRYQALVSNTGPVGCIVSKGFCVQVRQGRRYSISINTLKFSSKQTC